jgi:hypothetical protein
MSPGVDKRERTELRDFEEKEIWRLDAQIGHARPDLLAIVVARRIRKGADVERRHAALFDDTQQYGVDPRRLSKEKQADYMDQVARRIEEAVVDYERKLGEIDRAVWEDLDRK